MVLVLRLGAVQQDLLRDRREAALGLEAERSVALHNGCLISRANGAALLLVGTCTERQQLRAADRGHLAAQADAVLLLLLTLHEDAIGEHG